MSQSLKRVLRALARQGLDVDYVDGVYTVRQPALPQAPAAEILLPASLPLEGKALAQLAAVAALHHPGGGRMRCVCATPDFHPGDGGVPIGTVAASDSLVVPGLVGGDINCGMRLHVTDLTVDRFLAGKPALVAALRGDYLLGTRDIALRGAAMEATLRDGLPGFWEEGARHPIGRLARIDWGRLGQELDRVFENGHLGTGDVEILPAALREAEATVREDGLGTIGRGNHFVEVQVVEEIVDRARAWEWGVKVGQVALMIHSGSRMLGKAVGALWADRAREAWPQMARFPASRIFPICLRERPELAEAYLSAEAAASHYAFLNRALLAELFRGRLAEVYGEVDAPLVYDVPHNLTLREGDSVVARKGATPARPGQPVLIPGSMGTSSFLLVGKGAPRLLSSASHGAGRSRSRMDMAHLDRDQLGLQGVECHTLRDERIIEEAPAGYKPIHDVIDAQVAAGGVEVVARLRPLMTFKG